MKAEHIVNDKVEFVVMQDAKGENYLCGDAYYSITTEEYFICVLADGLGSGEFAHESSSAVTEVVKLHHHLALDELLDKCNEVLVKKRGAAVAIFKVLFHEQQFQYISVGNIRFFLYNPVTNKVVYPLPSSGYLSGRMGKYHEQTFEYEPHSKFMFFSDGLELKEITSFIKREAAIVILANEIWKGNVAQSDDVTLIMGSLLQ